MNQIRILDIAGSPFEMGRAHGEAFRNSIVHFTEERVALSADPKWSGQALGEAEVLALAEACVSEHERYSPDLFEELLGLSEATGLSPAQLIVNGGFTDFIDAVYNAYQQPNPVPANAGADNCTAFLVPDALGENQQGFFGQTWDMHDTATQHVIMLRGQPADKPGFLAFTTVGCVGMLGMNTEGVAIGINNLSATDGQVGVTWPFVIRKALAQATAEAALECVTEAKLAGAHNFLILDKTGAGYNVEAMPSRSEVTALESDVIVHTNHCLVPETLSVERKREPDAQAHSENRLRQGYKLLDKPSITETDLQALTRDPEYICTVSSPPRHIETCGAAIMRPASGDFWAVWGLPSENQYEHFRVT